MRATLYLFISSFLFTGCYGPAYTIKTEQDEFTDVKKTYMVGNMSSHSLGERPIEINLQRNISNNDTTYYIKTIYTAEDWLFVNALYVLANDETLKFYTSNVNRQVIYGGGIKETAYFTIKESEIVQIIESPELKVRLYGDDFYSERNLKPVNRERFLDFYRKYFQ